jgi:ATP-dependent Clp protease adaptor protein ClpS
MLESGSRPGVAVEEERGIVHDRLYRVLLHNDDVNTMDHVVRSLIKVFGFSEEAAASIMIEAHNNGVALCAVEPLERAELHRDQLISLSLSSTIEPE